MPDSQLLNDLVGHLLAGADTVTALRRVRQTLGRHVVERLVVGEDLDLALRASGAPPILANLIRTRASQLAPGPGLSVLLDAVYSVIGEGGEISGIPTAACLHHHLPHDREPTKEEYEEAWRKCLNAQHS